jgi:hypothetical protein
MVGRNSATSSWVAGYNMRSSNVTVGRDLIVKTNRDSIQGIGNWIKATTATIRVGRDFTIENGTGFMVASNMGQSRMIFNGQGGFYTTQTIASKGSTLHDVFINNPGASAIVQLNAANVLDNLYLNGSMEIDNGTFLTNGRSITFTGKGEGLKVVNGKLDNLKVLGTVLWFQGGGNDCSTANYLSTLATDNTLGMTIHIATGSPTFLQLLTDVTVKNLAIDNGCALVLNNHVLKLGTNTIGPGAYDQGMIYNTWADVSPIPEPGTMLLIGTGVVGLLGYLRRRRIK